MSDAMTMPAPANPTLRFVSKNWQTIASAATMLLAIGLARGKYSTVEARVDALEQTHPDTTAVLTRHNSDEVAAVRQRIDQISKDVSDTRVDVARLCASFGLQPISGIDGADGYRLIPGRENAQARP